jgi:hypothetical protein
MNSQLQPDGAEQLDEDTLALVRQKTAHKVNQAVAHRFQKSIEITRSEDAIGKSLWRPAVILAVAILGVSIVGLLLAALH